MIKLSDSHFIKECPGKILLLTNRRSMRAHFPFHPREKDLNGIENPAERASQNAVFLAPAPPRAMHTSVSMTCMNA